MGGRSHVKIPHRGAGMPALKWGAGTCSFSEFPGDSRGQQRAGTDLHLHQSLLRKEVRRLSQTHGHCPFGSMDPFNLFSSDMLRHTDMEMTVMKEDIYTHRCLEKGGVACHAGPPREAPGPVRRQREEGQVGKKLYFPGRSEGGKVSKLSRLSVGSFDHVGGLWGVEVAPTYPVPGPGVIYGRGIVSPTAEAWEQELGGGMDLWLVQLVCISKVHSQASLLLSLGIR